MPAATTMGWKPSSTESSEKSAIKIAAEKAKAEEIKVATEAAKTAENIKKTAEADMLKASQDKMRGIADKPAATIAIDSPFRESQLAVMKQLQDRANGVGPSIAQMQQQQAGNKALQNTLGSVRAGMGGNAALTARTAALAGGRIQADLASDSAILRLKEIQDAQALLGNVAAQGRGQDINVSSSNADLEAKQRALGAGAYQAILGNDTARQEGAANRQTSLEVAAIQRAAAIEAAKAGRKGGGESILGGLSGLISAGAAIFGGKGENAAAAAKGARNSGFEQGSGGTAGAENMEGGTSAPSNIEASNTPDIDWGSMSLTKPSPVTKAAKRRKTGVA